MRTCLLLIGFWSCIAMHCGGQPVSTEELLDHLADQLLATVDADVSYDELYEALTHLLSNPVDLNTVTREQLRAVMLLNEREINALLKYRDDRGPFMSILELQAIPGWSDETVRNLAPFVRVRDPASRIDQALVKRMRSETNAYLVMRYERTLETKRGYAAPEGASERYAGNPDKYYLRYRASRQGDFSVGITAEKDPGETFEWTPGKQYGFDFLSGHLQLLNKGRLVNLVAGDFQAQFGQGLQFGSVFGLGKTAQTITGIRRSNLGFMPYMSASESYYLRGLAATVRISQFIQLHFFGSWKKRDAAAVTGEPAVSSLQNTGLHRTQLERDARDQVSDRDLGAVLQYRNQHLDLGVILSDKQLAHPVIPTSSPYNQFAFTGSGYRNVGCYFNYSRGNITLFSEAARTITFGSAVTVGVLGNLTPRLEMSWLYRSFDKNYYSAYANAIAEGSVPQNEQGLYWGTRYSFSRKLVFSGYADFFSFPWLKYRIYRPSNGTEWLVRVDFSPSKNKTFYIQAREETKMRNRSDDDAIYQVVTGTKRQAWLSGEFEIVPNFRLKTRLQGSEFEIEGHTTNGVALVQDVTWKKGRWSVSARYALFDTEDYDNRQYVYEKDVWMATSLPAYDGTGLRNYILVHFSASKHVDFWARWGRTWYADREVIGSSGEEIEGNARNDIKFQLRIRP